MKRERNQKTIKRAMGMLLCAVLTAGSLSVLPAAAASVPEPPSGLPEPVKVFDFDGYQAGDAQQALTQDGWTLNNNAKTHILIVDKGSSGENKVGEGHGQYLKFNSAASVTAEIGLSHPLAKEDGLVKPDTDFTVTWEAYYEAPSQGASAANVSFSNDGNAGYGGYLTKVVSKQVRYQQAAGVNTLATAVGITMDVWHELAMVYDHTTKKVRLFVDGICVADDVIRREDTVNPELLYLGFNYAENLESNLRVDNIAVYDQKLYPDSLYVWTDFESGIHQTGALPPTENTGWYNSGTNEHIQVAAADEAPNRYLEMNAAGIGSNNAITYFVFRGKRKNNETSYTTMPTTGDFTIAWDVYFEGEGHKGFDIAVVNDSANKGLVTRYINTTGTFGVNSAEGANVNAEIGRTLQLSRGRWHHMALAYTEDSRTARVYIDGVDIGHVCNDSMNQDLKPVALFLKANGDSSGEDNDTTAVMRIDNIRVDQGALEGLQTVTQPQLSLEQGEGTASARALVDAALGEDAILFLAQYGEGEQLVQVKTASRKVTPPAENNSGKHGYNELTVTDSLDENAKSIKAFLWDSSQGMVPYCQGLQADAAASLAD